MKLGHDRRRAGAAGRSVQHPRPRLRPVPTQPAIGHHNRILAAKASGARTCHPKAEQALK